MEITLEWIAQNFARFNHQYFDDSLPIPIFRIVRDKDLFGQCGTKRRVYPVFFIKLSVYVERTEYEYQNTLLHEMIHLYLFDQKDWTAAHGEKFIALASRINQDGWNIKIPRKCDRTKLDPKRAELQRKLKQINKLHKHIFGRTLLVNRSCN